MHELLARTTRRKWTWTAHRIQQGTRVIEIVSELRDYWPLTIRQIFYRLVAAGYLENTRSKYCDLSNLIKHMRLDDWLPREVLEDRARRVSDKRGWEDHQDFMTAHVEAFLEGYERCYVQGQKFYLELWCEKDALSPVFERVAYPYCIRAVTCRGYQSITFLDGFRRRALAAQRNGQVPIILYFGDMDPSGYQMLEAVKQTLEDDIELRDVEYHRVALTLNQIQEYGLPHDPGAVKTTDRRYRKYVQRFGPLAVELDALHPEVLRSLAVEAIESYLDKELFREQMEMEKLEQERLAAIKQKILSALPSLTSQTSVRDLAHDLR